jgi:hypothetical protein
VNAHVTSCEAVRTEWLAKRILNGMILNIVFLVRKHSFNFELSKQEVLAYIFSNIQPDQTATRAVFWQGNEDASP